MCLAAGLWCTFMRFLTLFAQLCVVLVLALTSGGTAAAVERLAVLEIQGDIPERELNALTDEVRGAVIRRLGSAVQVMTRENMEVMLSDMGIDSSCVSEGACEVETARNLGVDYVVSGSLVALSGKQVATLKLHRTDNGQLLGSERAQADDVLALLDAVDAATGKLVTPLSSNRGPAEKAVQQPVVAKPQPPQPQPTSSGISVSGSAESPNLGKLVCFTGGTFAMGPGRRSVKLSRGWCVMEHEVTQGQWEAMGEKNKSKFSACGADCPVERVSWNDALDFANRVSEAEGLTPVYEGSGAKARCNWDANGYRLLTSAEWEASAEGTSGGWTKENAGKTTHPVCTGARNGHGLCDMLGNVWEFLWDAEFKGGTDPSTQPVTDPRGGPIVGYRSIAGGSWDLPAVPTTHRYNMTPPQWTASHGFRLTRSTGSRTGSGR